MNSEFFGEILPSLSTVKEDVKAFWNHQRTNVVNSSPYLMNDVIELATSMMTLVEIEKDVISKQIKPDVLGKYNKIGNDDEE